MALSRRTPALVAVALLATLAPAGRAAAPAMSPAHSAAVTCPALPPGTTGTPCPVTGALLAPDAPDAPPATPCVAVATTCPAWTDLFDGPVSYSDWGMASAMDRAGGTLVSAGWETVTTSSVAGVVLGYAAGTGTRAWKAELPGSDGLPVVVWSTAQMAPDGRTVFVAGTMYSSEKCRVVAAAYDTKSGARRWYAPQPVGPTPCQYYTKSAVAPDGRTYYVATDTAVTSGGGKIRNGQTLAFDARTGARRWSARAVGATQHWRVTTSPDGRRVYVVSDVLDEAQGLAVAWRVQAYDARTGAALWSTSYACLRKYGSAAPVQEQDTKYCVSQPAGLVATKDRVFLTGSNAFGWATVQVAAFAAGTGKHLWHVDRDPLRSFLYLNDALALTADGKGVIGARVRLDPAMVNPPQFVVERFAAATGKVEWTAVVAANVTSQSYCGGCGPILATDGTRQAYVTGGYPLGDSVQVTAGIDLRSGSVAWSGLLVWHVTGEASAVPQSINAPAGARVVGGTTAVMDPGACGMCYDVGSMVYRVPG